MTTLDGWLPARIHTAPLKVEWRYLAGRPLIAPFFEDAIRGAPRRDTSLDDALAWGDAHPAPPPRGFVFHMSRCGSTLIARMLAALPEHRVLSEPPALDDALRLPDLDVERRIVILRAMMNALAAPQPGAALFVKWDCWLIHEFAAIRRAYPDTPWIFLYRDPLEVLVSQLEKPGMWTIPPDATPRVEYCAMLLARICETAIANVEDGGALVDYTELPEIAASQLADFFGLPLDAAQRAAMLDAARFDAKAPAHEFARDSERKRRAASLEVTQAVERWLREPQARLESFRRSGFGLAARTRPAAPASPS